MKYNTLGNSDLRVSQICLGTMTWGEQNTEAQAHSQLDLALERGVNFFDTAEMYPIPPKKETYTQTESIIGRWSKLKEQRDKIILATKVIGPMPSSPYIRNGSLRLNKENIQAALEGSLNRLKTDYIDLYQIHWPQRKTNFFGQLFYSSRKVDPSLESTREKHREQELEILETLEVLSELKKSGKIRHIGVSNETPWGVMTYLKFALKNPDLPKIISIQNPYNLLNRSFEVGLSEVSLREEVGLLAYSPLGFGTLSGKYLNGQFPKNARLSLFNQYQRYSSPNAQRATQMYVDLARKISITPAQLALAFVNQQSFCPSNIIGATNLDQLNENIDSVDIELSEEVLDEIDRIHSIYPIPSP